MHTKCVSRHAGLLPTLKAHRSKALRIG